MQIHLDWAEGHFRLSGHAPAPAIDLATELISRVQGAIALATSLRKPDIITAEIERVEQWLLTIQSPVEAAGVSHPREPWGVGTRIC